MTSIIEQIRAAEAELPTLNETARSTHAEAMEDGEISSDEQQRIDTIDGKISDLRDMVERLRDEWQQNKDNYEQLREASAEILASASVCEYEILETDQASITTAETATDASAGAEDFAQALVKGGELERLLADFRARLDKIEEQRAEYEPALAALQPRLDQYSQSTPELAYVDQLMSDLVTTQTEMETAATAGDYENALSLLAALTAKLDEIDAAIEAKKAEYETARAALDRLVSAARGNLTAATQTEFDAIAPTLAPIDTAAGIEDWVAAIAAIAPAQAKIDAFNVAMQKAELPGMTTGMSDDALEIAGQSPALTETLEDLRDEGWQVQVGTAGGGSFASGGANPTITIDPNGLGDPAGLVQTLAHEAGHADYDNQIDTSSTESYVTSMLGDEGQATLNNIRVQREILANGGEDIGIAGNSGNHAAYNEAYDQYLEDGDEEAARNAIGAIFGAGEVPSVNKPDGTPYADYNEYYEAQSVGRID